MNKMFGMCLNWKVIGGLAAVGVAVVLFAPPLLPTALPLLAVLVCPLSMGAMMWGMSRMGGMQGSACQAEPETPAVRGELSREAQLAQLRAELRSLDARQSTLAGQVAALEQSEPGCSGVTVPTGAK